MTTVASDRMLPEAPTFTVSVSPFTADLTDHENPSMHSTVNPVQSFQYDFSSVNAMPENRAGKSTSSQTGPQNSGTATDEMARLMSAGNDWNQFDIYDGFWTDYSLNAFFEIMHTERPKDRLAGAERWIFFANRLYDEHNVIKSDEECKKKVIHFCLS